MQLMQFPSLCILSIPLAFWMLSIFSCIFRGLLTMGFYYALLSFLHLFLPILTLTRLAVVVHVDLPIGKQYFLDLISQLGTQRNNLFSPNPQLKLTIVLSLILWLKLVGFVSSYLILLFTLTSPAQVQCHNISATYLIANPIHHDHSKHITLDYLFVHERVAHIDLFARHVPTRRHLADIIKKGLSSQQILLHMSNQSVVCLLPSIA